MATFSPASSEAGGQLSAQPDIEQVQQQRRARRPGRSPRARRLRRLQQQQQSMTAASTDDEGVGVEQQPKERFLFIPCQHCPGNGKDKQCFHKILITESTWNKIRHFDLASTPAPRPVNTIAPVVKDDIQPPLNAALPAPPRPVNPPQPV
jgi:hypothetical protein